MIGLAFKAVAVVVFGLASIYPCLGIAQTEPDKFNEAVDLTIKTAEHLCGSLSQSGNQQSFSVKGDISTQLLALLKSLGNIGISGVGTYSQDSYQGVVREQLSDALKDERQCKEKVFSILVQAFITPRQSTLSDARLVFSRAEPYKIPFYTQDGKDMSIPSLKLWFKNAGQSAAQNESFVEMIFPKNMSALLSEKDEEDAFNLLKNRTKSEALHNDIQPGSEGYFFVGVGLTDEAWADNTNNSGPPKFLYVMSLLTYHSENLDSHDTIITETCVIYANKDGFNNWINCRSDHNGIRKVK